MKLFEFQAKELLQSKGFHIPSGRVVQSSRDGLFTFPSMIKAQVLEGKRARRGLIQPVHNQEEIDTFISKHNASFYIVEEFINHEKEYFISISYDSIKRSPILLFSESGGVSVESQKVHTFVLDLQPDFTEFNQFLLTNQYPEYIAKVAEQLYTIFLECDLLLCEINPLVIHNEKPIILDAKIEIDDNAQFRQKELFEKYDTRKISLNEREQAARLIDENDLRGVAGKSYLDLDGDIAILASGGGASLAAMDILLDAGGKPANYAEYGGNPPREKVKKLTALTLSKENLAGCWIVGVIANFTDIYETFQGIIDAILELPQLPRYPIVIRRAGPNDDKAHVFIEDIKRQYNLDIHFYDEQMSIGESAKEIIKRSNQFKEVQNAYTR